MSSHKKHDKEQDAASKATDPVEATAGAAVAEREQKELQAELVILQEELEKAQERNEELHNLRLREQAEFENFKKRRLAEQDRHEKMALRSLMMELIEVDSNFLHALAGGEGDFEAYKKGVEMIAGQLSGLLDRHGVSRINALNQPFDHDLHEAMLQIEEGDHAGLKVVEVVREGYLMHEQVLRLAGVKVAKGSGEEVPEEEAGSEK